MFAPVFRLLPSEGQRLAFTLSFIVKHSLRAIVSPSAQRKARMERMSPFIHSPECDVVVGSVGGVASMALWFWLNKYKNTLHTHSPLLPPRTGRPLRLIYIFGDPILSILSIFNRQLQLDRHYECVAGSYFKLSDMTLLLKMRSLKSYLASDLGAFPLRQHFHNWRTAPTQHPVLFMRSETIWDNFDVLQSFLDLPKEAMDLFPKKKKRHSAKEILNLTPRQQEKLNQLYGDFKEELKQMPDIYIRPAD